jgi:cation:H+ antiporter
MTLATDQLYINIILIIVGLFLLLKGSNWFIDSATYIAKKFDVSDMVIGLTLVSIGTSLPELGANVYASLSNQGEVALGNVVGSNITNITLILGIGATLAGKLQIPKSLLTRDSIILVITYFLLIYISIFNFLTPTSTILRWEGFLLLFFFIIYVFMLFKSKDINEEESESDEHFINTVLKAIIFFIIGFLMITIGAKISVDSVVAIATTLNISKEIISGTIIAFGTSVPELAVTVISIKKNKNNLALGNIVGSCIFNILLVMGVAVVIRPVNISLDMSTVFMPMMLFSGALLAIFMRIGYQLARWEGIVLISLYLVYIAYNMKQVLFS